MGLGIFCVQGEGFQNVKQLSGGIQRYLEVLVPASRQKHLHLPSCSNFLVVKFPQVAAKLSMDAWDWLHQ